MLTPSLLLLCVEDPRRSAAFHERLLGVKPTASFPTYADFKLENGLTLGLWSTQAPNFRSAGSGHRGELAFRVRDAAAVDELCGRWRAEGVVIEQEPMTAVFGRTFVALDPDGHRLRVCPPGGA